MIGSWAIFWKKFSFGRKWGPVLCGKGPAHHTVNARMARFIRSRAGVVVRHRKLEGDNRWLMRMDGVHLNENGLDIFLTGGAGVLIGGRSAA